MNTVQLCDLLYKEVFSWVGLPASINGDLDSRLTASQMRALCKYLQVKLKLSVAYHPQTDGTSERFHSTMMQMIRAFVSDNHRIGLSTFLRCCMPITAPFTRLQATHPIWSYLVGALETCVPLCLLVSLRTLSRFRGCRHQRLASGQSTCSAESTSIPEKC